MREFKIGDRVTSVPCQIVYVDETDEKLPYRVAFEPKGAEYWVPGVQAVVSQPAPDALTPGDLVELKSHSAPMTVVSVAGSAVSVVYTQYGGNGFMDHGGPRIVERTFPLAVLKKVEAK
jgi:hypothetical protein